jgi:hypothetical protein
MFSIYYLAEQILISKDTTSMYSIKLCNEVLMMK